MKHVLMMGIEPGMRKTNLIESLRNKFKKLFGENATIRFKQLLLYDDNYNELVKNTRTRIRGTYKLLRMITSDEEMRSFILELLPLGFAADVYDEDYRFENCLSGSALSFNINTDKHVIDLLKFILLHGAD